MKKLLKRIFIFLLLPVISLTATFLTELKREYAWKSIPGDCENRGSWIYNRIFNNEEPIDVAFLGTSHVINGIQDTLITSLLSTKNRQPTTAINLGYCRFGNEMQYIIAKDLFEHKKVKKVFIEINQTFGVGSHPVYPYYARTEDVITPPSYVNQKVFSNMYDAFLARLSQLRNNLFDGNEEVKNEFPEYGYRGYANAVDPAQLHEPVQGRVPPTNSLRKLNTSYSKAWIKALVDLCKQNNAQVYFVYLPSYSSQPQPTEELDFYSSQAPLMIIPREDINDKNLWRDPDHFNDRGAEKFSRWLAGQIISQ